MVAVGRRSSGTLTNLARFAGHATEAEGTDCLGSRKARARLNPFAIGVEAQAVASQLVTAAEVPQQSRQWKRMAFAGVPGFNSLLISRAR